jgi:chorismate mutase/prephenate dehydratase
MSDKNDDLGELRNRIDDIDKQIQQLINDRAGCALKVASVKQQEMLADSKSGDDVKYYRPERESEVLREVIERNHGPLGGTEMARIFREIMSACLALEKPLEVAYFGPEGTYTQAAALKHFGQFVKAVPTATIAEVFAQVESGSANYGVVPVENSTEGMVNHTLDNFIQSPLKICGEVELRIHHHLLLKSGEDRQQVRKICAHQQTLAQCRNWLNANWPSVEIVAVSSNGEAARLAASEPGVAALAGDIAADQYGLVKDTENVEDYSDNTTRFLIIGIEEVPPSGKDKTSIIVSAHNRPGSLYKLLEPFYREDVSLTRIDTRPSRTENWTYVFFIEFEGHGQDKKIAGILSELKEHSMTIKVLGSYPQSVL